MKYLIGNVVMNSDHIVRATYTPGDDKLMTKSEVRIQTNEPVENVDWQFILCGLEADCFWQIYSGDALDVMKEAQS